jgi:TusA-related sulfurtransferase
MREQTQAKKAPTWMDNLLGPREIGNVHIAVCSMTMDLYGLTLADLEPIVDEITGVATFVEQARTGELTLFIYWQRARRHAELRIRDTSGRRRRLAVLVWRRLPTATLADIAIDKEIDARGSFCPGPLMELIRGVKALPIGGTLAVLSSDPGSAKDIPAWMTRAGHEFIGAFPEQDFTRFVVRKTR